MSLTPKQKAFVTEYVICRSGAEAARRAKYSTKTARQMAAENLTKPFILSAIAAKEAEMSEKLGLDRNVVIGGIFSGISQARGSNDAGGIIRGWLALGKITGLDKPEELKNLVLSASNEALEARLAVLSDAELLAIAEGSGS
jgi:hypothetical protein